VSHPSWPDRSLGVFETILVAGGAPVELDAHMRRLRASAEELFGTPLPATARTTVLEQAASQSLGRLRLTARPADDEVLELEVVAGPIARMDVFPAWERAVPLHPFELRGGLGAHKWADRALLEGMEARAPGRLPLVFDARGDVLEASRANLFAVRGEALITAPADGRILAGVARARVIATARALDIELREETLSLEGLIASGAAFLTGSLRGVEPVRSVGDAELAPPGPAAERVAADLRRTWLGGAGDELAGGNAAARRGDGASR